MPKRPGISEIREMILRHARMEVEFKGENIAMREMRKQVAWYTAGCPHSSSCLLYTSKRLPFLEETV